ncbi:hypothetical protein M409DRAFT_50052 [Zasmidium cellare ATCC 36951]|uniref:Uncharacterized protein n=1 Tax=Zasmidium cellare ATCC 36951 TaxID=1080233 RepID=A0A6A6CZ72_ZASCE|nr:uncharacterized protein M409DRAFT_50052 [Zasmidium cellare ATCC 36951]KAF2172335.1 hypothetical protein M409DRAFT_50052 [Zasmidium cellare ATCC 36951]
MSWMTESETGFETRRCLAFCPCCPHKTSWNSPRGRWATRGHVGACHGQRCPSKISSTVRATVQRWSWRSTLQSLAEMTFTTPSPSSPMLRTPAALTQSQNCVSGPLEHHMLTKGAVSMVRSITSAEWRTSIPRPTCAASSEENLVQCSPAPGSNKHRRAGESSRQVPLYLSLRALAERVSCRATCGGGDRFPHGRWKGERVMKKCDRPPLELWSRSEQNKRANLARGNADERLLAGVLKLSPIIIVRSVRQPSTAQARLELKMLSTLSFPPPGCFCVSRPSAVLCDVARQRWHPRLSQTAPPLPSITDTTITSSSSSYYLLPAALR